MHIIANNIDDITCITYNYINIFHKKCIQIFSIIKKINSYINLHIILSRRSFCGTYLMNFQNER